MFSEVFGYWILDFVLQFFSAPDPWLEIPAISRREGRGEGGRALFVCVFVLLTLQVLHN